MVKNILLGALVCAAVAGIVYYISDPEKFHETLDDLKSSTDDLIGKAKDQFSKQQENMQGLAV